MTRTKLSVNINKVALIRNSRGEGWPDIVKFAQDCERFGADGITVHPRPDERHVRYDDVPKLKSVVKTELNIEGNPTKRFMDMVLREQPHQCTLVPDDPDALTSDEGWDTVKHQAFLKETISALKEAGIRVSIFVNDDVRMIEGAAETGTDRVELYTGPYAQSFAADPAMAVEGYRIAAVRARDLGLGVNAGHDLSLENLTFLIREIPFTDEVSIGHALISDALYLGIEETIRQYQEKIFQAFNI